RFGLPGRRTRRAGRGRARARRDDRREVPDDHPSGQGVAQRDRSRGRETLVPVRARLHVRAEHRRRVRRGPAGVHRQARRQVHAVTTDKRTTIEGVVAELSDGMTIGIGGWGSRRKPMAIVRAIARSSLKDLTIASYGGPDVGLLCATGAVRKVIFGFVTLDQIPLDPHFQRARESGAIEATEMDEGMFYLSLLAASWRVPFLPTRAGLGSDVMRVNPSLKTVRSPYGDEEVVAVPPLKLDAAIVHMNRSDASGNA